MRTISKRKWDRCLPCYKQVKASGEKWMLYNKNGMTIWGPVKIKEVSINRKEVRKYGE